MVASESKQASADPRRVADVLLAAAVRSNADSVYVEPLAGDDERYQVSLERTPVVLATTVLDGRLGSAVIARLALLAALDLAAPHAQRGVIPVRSGTLEAEVVVTIRPGSSLRADLMVIARSRDRPAPTAAVALSIGATIGQYRVLKLLGEGGMGSVFLVEHVALGRHYALKVLRATIVERDATATQQFLREARTAARIHHPNIVDVFDFGHLSDGRPYFVMELLDGESLASRVRRGPLSPAEVVLIGRQLATGLAAAHDRGVVHADVTPSNVLVLGGGPLQVKLVDFGLAELVSERVDQDNPVFALGTPAYISPEQLRGLAATERSDQYGLGAVLFELLTGKAPFEHDDLRSLCMMHLHAPVPPIESPLGPLPPRLAEVVTTCLQKAPSARFPGMRALGAALEEVERVTGRPDWRRWLSR